MLRKLSEQLSGEDWMWNNLNALCRANGFIYGSKVEEHENRFFVMCLEYLIPWPLFSCFGSIWSLMNCLPLLLASIRMHPKVYKIRSSTTIDRGKYIFWTSEMDNCLTDVLMEQVEKGNKVDNILKPAAFAAALKALNEKFVEVTM